MQDPRQAADRAIQEGLRAHHAGDLATAESAYRKAIKQLPRHPHAHDLLGIVLAQSGRFTESVEAFKKAVEQSPNNPDIALHLATALDDAGRPQEAVEMYDRLLQTVPNDPNLQLRRANSLLRSGNPQAAAEGYEKVAKSNPNEPQAAMHWGLALQQLGQKEQALEQFQKAVRLKPDGPLENLNLASCLADLNRFDQALAAYRRALQLESRRPDMWADFGTFLVNSGRHEEAIEPFDRALALDPAFVQAVTGRGASLQRIARYAEALEAYRTAEQIEPQNPDHISNQAWILGEQGHADLAREAYARAIPIAGPKETGISLRRMLTFPVIYDSVQHIERVREQLKSDLDAFQKTGPHIEDPLAEAGLTPFFLAYHGLNNRDLQIEIAGAIRNAAPSLTLAAPPNPPKRPKPKVAVVSAHLRQHSVGFVSYGMIRDLPRDLVSVTVVRPQFPADDLTAKIDAWSDEVVFLPSSLREARQTLVDLAPDVILYADIGQEALTYYLAFARIAPIQCALWGHPDTTGITSLDAYLSSKSFEPPNAQDAYSEKLVAFDRLYCDMARPNDSAAPAGRTEWGLPDGGRIYLCPQSLFKFHPDFDDAIRAILESDEQALFVIPAGVAPDWNDLLMARLNKTCQKVADRIRIIDRVHPDRFPSLLASADAIVDPLHFTGGYTSYIALGLGLPVVTWDGNLMRGRMTSGLYRQMGFDGLVASNAQDFAAMAVRLAKEGDYKLQIRREILDKSARLFNDVEPVKQLGSFLAKAAADPASLAK